MDAQMKRGVLEMCVLYQFLSGDFYGYEMMVRMRNFFPDVNDSSFYAILRRLHTLGYTEVYYGSESGGPQRKYYSITEKGKEYYQEQKDSWQKLKKCVAEIGIDDSE
ncbi:MAG: PadR family transcriptional regulator [Eubacterium sp.]|nr:PadR family transcriptional regulator [Eubacterium sp.]